jgi:hypothetical protein
MRGKILGGGADEDSFSDEVWGIQADKGGSSIGTRGASVSKVDDGWRLRRDSMVQVSVFTAKVYGHLIRDRRRTRVGIKDYWLLVERAWGSRSSVPWVISQSASCQQCKVAGSLALILSFGWGSLLGGVALAEVKNRVETDWGVDGRIEELVY